MAERTRALLLDALGTLVELPPPGPALREELQRRYALTVTEAQATHALGAEIAYFRRHMHLGVDAASLAGLRRRCAEVLRGALAPAAALSTEEVLAALLGALRFRAFPDAAPALEAARADGLRVVVASNWDVSLHEVLERIGLRPLLDGVVTSAETGAAKPAAAVFRRALEQAGDVLPGAAVHVGDSAVEDIEGARTAGLRAILIDRGGAPERDGIETITTLAQLRGLL
jgi:putative hydrolase of the HAD superfamily